MPNPLVAAEAHKHIGGPGRYREDAPLPRGGIAPDGEEQAEVRASSSRTGRVMVDKLDLEGRLKFDKAGGDLRAWDDMNGPRDT